MSETLINTVGRRAAEARMLTVCSITRVVEGGWSDTLMDNVDTISTIYAGKCRLKSTTSTVADYAVQGQVVTDQDMVLYLPIATSGLVDKDDKVTIVDGGPDPALTGRTLRVTGLFTQTWATARRLPVETITE